MRNYKKKHSVDKITPFVLLRFMVLPDTPQYEYNIEILYLIKYFALKSALTQSMPSSIIRGVSSRGAYAPSKFSPDKIRNSMLIKKSTHGGHRGQMPHPFNR